MSDWEFFGEHIGFPIDLIEKIKSTYGYNYMAQIQAFLRECLIPDCGDVRTKVIFHRVKQVVKLPKGKAKNMVQFLSGLLLNCLFLP